MSALDGRSQLWAVLPADSPEAKSLTEQKIDNPVSGRECVA